MTKSVLHRLSRAALMSLADALDEGRLVPPFEAGSLSRHVPHGMGAELAPDFQTLIEDGLDPSHLAITLRLLAEEREQGQRERDRIQLVWSGREVIGSGTHDTRYVVADMFASAREHVLISTYALDSGDQAAPIFQPLMENMSRNPDLEVQLYLNVARKLGDKRPEHELLAETVEKLRTFWVTERPPRVYYEPRALAPFERNQKRACLHVKCLVVDRRRFLITSANFTEAANDRNLEAGLVIEDGHLANQLLSQFETLRQRELFVRLPGF